MSRGKPLKLNVYCSQKGFQGTFLQLRHRCHGFSLLEVLLALLILSFSLLALANLATVAWRRTYDAYLASLAVNLAANRVEAAYAQDARQYANVWQQNVADVLPQGQGSYANTQGSAQTKVCWHQLFRSYQLCYTLEILRADR